VARLGILWGMRVIALVLLLGVCAVAPAATAAAPRVWLSTEHPLKVAGRAFSPGETVRVVVFYGKARYLLAARVGPTGRFWAGSAHSLLANCANLTITATGSQGDRAVYKVPASDCGTSPGP
jgi:hypothetical protein